MCISFRFSNVSSLRIETISQCCAHVLFTKHVYYTEVCFINTWRNPNTGIRLEKFCYYDHFTVAGTKGQSASGLTETWSARLWKWVGYVPVALVTWSPLCDGVRNRHVKNDSVRSYSILWKSHKLHETKVIYSRASNISGEQMSKIWKGRCS